MKMTTFDPGALEAYRAAWRALPRYQAICEDYRADSVSTPTSIAPTALRGAQSLRHLLVLWATLRRDRGLVRPAGAVGSMVGRRRFGSCRRRDHFLAEDRPDEVAQLLVDFFG